MHQSSPLRPWIWMLRLLTVPGRRPFSATVLAVAVLGLLISDVMYGQSLLNSNWSLGGPTDLGWVVFYGGLGLAAPLANVDRITVVSTGDGTAAGAHRITGDLAAIAAQVPALFESLSGMQMSDLLAKVKVIGARD